MKALYALSACIALTACASHDAGGPTAQAQLQSRSGSKVSGSLKFTQVGSSVRVTGDITGHTPGKRAIHIHEKGDCSAADGMSAGGHFNPHKAKHGAPGAGHAGDLGNLVVDDLGRASINQMVSGISVSSSAADGIIGRAVIIHAQEDDLKTDPTGNAGGRVACGVIQ